jgi:cytochrome P450
MIPPYVLHRHRTLWTDPDCFDPDRFMPERRASIDRYAYLPFGAGPRVCIGASFSIQEAVIVLSRVVKSVRLDTEPDQVVRPVQRVTLRPDGGVPMRLSLRG